MYRFEESHYWQIGGGGGGGGGAGGAEVGGIDFMYACNLYANQKGQALVCPS